MKNPHYNAVALTESVKSTIAEVEQGLALLKGLAEKLPLTGDEYEGYFHDHASEHLHWAAKRLNDAAERALRLTLYTNYPPLTALPAVDAAVDNSKERPAQ